MTRVLKVRPSSMRWGGAGDGAIGSIFLWHESVSRAQCTPMATLRGPEQGMNFLGASSLERHVFLPQVSQESL